MPDLPATLQHYLRRRQDVASLAEALGRAPDGRGRAEAGTALRWAEREEACELRLSAAAHALAAELAQQGDAQAAGALTRAEGLAGDLVEDLRSYRSGETAQGRGRDYTSEAEGTYWVQELRRRLEHARRMGAPFGSAWAWALGELPSTWRLAVTGTRRAWEAAYLRQPDRAGAALAALGEPGGNEEHRERSLERVA